MSAHHWLREDYQFSAENWYNPYSILNNMPLPPSPSTLKEIQINAIKMNNSKLSAEVEHFNSFLLKLQNFAKSEMKIDSEADFFSVFLKKINSGYGFFDTTDLKNIKPSKDMSWLGNYIDTIGDFTKIIARYSGKEIPKKIADDIKRIQEHIEGGNFYGFRYRKAQLWEDLAEWILSIAGFESIGSGALIDKAGKQFVQDVIAYLPGQLQNKPGFLGSGGLGVEIRYTGTKTQNENKELYDWAQQEAQKKIVDQVDFSKKRKGYVGVQVQNQIEGFKNLMDNVQHSLTKKVTVKIDDPTKEYLQAFLSVQAKSGSGQALLNNSGRDLIDISALSAWDTYLKILNDFYNNFSQNEKVENGESETLAAYTNWVFSKNIAKTTLGKNTFFLSRHGFATLDQSMSLENFYFKLAPNPNSLKLLNSTSFSIEETKS